MIKHGQILCTADTRRKLEDVLVGFGFSRRFIQPSWAPALFSTEHMLTTCISTINFGLCNCIVNVLNISVLLACDYESRPREGTLNLCGCYDRNLSMSSIIIQNYQDMVMCGLIWCQFLSGACAFADLTTSDACIAVLLCKCPNGLVALWNRSTAFLLQVT